MAYANDVVMLVGGKLLSTLLLKFYPLGLRTVVCVSIPIR